MPVLARLALLAALAAAGPGARASDGALVLATRAWGLAKYHHPAVTACALDWDQALLDRVAALDAAPDATAAAAVVSAMLDAAGDAGAQAPTDATPAWIRALAPPLRDRLAWLAAQRPARQCYVTPVPFTGQADFANDAGHAVVDPDRAHRVLAVARFWNAIEWWFPYKADIGRDWANALHEHLPRVLAAPDRLAYIHAMRTFTARIEDSHAFFGYLPGEGASRLGIPGFEIRGIEGKAIVTQVLPVAAGVRPGDEVIAIDGLTIAQARAQREPLSHGSNPAFFNLQVLRGAINGVTDPGRFRLRRPDGSEYETELARRFDHAFGSLPPGTPMFGVREARGGCRMGLIDMGRLMPADVVPVLEALKDTDALVFDLRNYPNGTGGALSVNLFDRAHPASIITRPRFDAPGVFFPVPLSNSPGVQRHRGPLLVLHDERSISQSEFVMMMLQSGGTAITFGSQTAAADGNVTQVALPGGISVTFTGLGVFYPDGRATQRIGIVPDVHVVPTIAGLAAGKDEVLDTALDCRWTAQRPPRRTPSSGIYSDPARGGEGIDVHRDVATVAALGYGYTDAGEPEWILTAAPRGASGFGNAFTRSRARGATSESVPAAIDFHAGPYEPVCATSNQNALHPRGRLRWPLDGGAHRDACQLPLLASGASPRTGLWAGPANDAGWGLSVHEAGGLLTVIVYAYDNAGEPRWLLGQAPWSGEGAVAVPLRKLRGACRACPGSAPIESEAGALTLKLDGVASGNAADNWATLEARFDTGAPWRRQQMPLRRVTQRAE